VSAWCLVANVRPDADPRGVSTGTRHFASGAKVWCLPVRWGDGYERIRVIGRHRGSLRHVLMVMPGKRLTRWRSKQAHHPEVLRLLAEQGGWRDRELVEDTARFMEQLHPAIEDLRDAAQRLRRALHLLDEPRGRALEREATAALGLGASLPPVAVLVLADWLEQEGGGLPVEQLVELLVRRERHLAGR
jgi:hypothetical protein